jgi:hypothetical protein
MKICPKCQTKYTDSTLKFCLQDGTELLGESSGSGSHPTVSFEESETLVSGSKPEQISFDLNKTNDRNWQESQVTRVSNVPDQPNNSKTVIAVLATALVMFLLFGIVGIGTYLYINSGGTEVVTNRVGSNTNEQANADSIAGSQINSKTPADLNSKTPTPETSPIPDKTKEPTPTPEQVTDPGEIKKEVANRIYTWKSAAEAINLNSYMTNYAERIDYYRKNGASKSFVRSDKQKAFSKYDSIKVQISNISVKPGSDGQTAIAVIDKAWDFSGPVNNSSGKVRQQLKFKKSGDRWLITSEKDLKVYYVNK